MIRKLLFNWTARLPCRLIRRDGTAPYLERYYLARGVYLHRFVGCDGDKEVHDHPWDAWAICLAGGYVEERLICFDLDEGWLHKLRTIKRFSINRIRGNDFHRIARTEPETWTLFVHGDRWKGWGFLQKLPWGGAGYHQPFDTAVSLNWHRNALTGATAGREPMA